MTKIYTKKGDKGETRTYLGKMSKSDDLAEALGSLDEANSWIGICRSQIFNYQFSITNQLLKNKFSKQKIDVELKRIQTNLMIITTSLAGSELKMKDGEVKHLEKFIDELTKELPKLTNFIYPVGYLQYARAVIRRAERAVTALNFQLPITNFQSNSKLQNTNNKTVLKYLNRLSDALFVMGRWVNFKTGIKEEEWKA